MIKKSELTEGSWYKGKGRNANVAMWDGLQFLTFGNRFGEWVIKLESHWDDEGPFQPIEKIIGVKG